MKRLLAVILLIGTIGAIFANPIEMKLIGRIWFTEQNQPKLEFSPHMFYNGTADVIIYDGYDSYTYAVDFTADNPVIIDLPQAHLSREQGYLQATIVGYVTDSVSWGESIANGFSSLVGTQCATQLLVSGWESSYYLFAKDYSTESGSAFDTLARITINVHCSDQNGNPASNYPIMMMSMWPPLSYTDSNGNASFSFYCCKAMLSVRSLTSWDVVADTVFFAEPDQTYNIDFVVPSSAINDQFSQIPQGNFSIYPNVLRSHNSGVVNLSYDAKLDADSHIELYDIKGRLIESRVYTATNMQLQLPRLASGVYFLRLSSKGRLLGNSKLIVLK
ncbi:MAG: hypothetical protein CVU50_09615 [Candidatus Cloacimonetes bacterium HGW-Cloacimonetes-3]|jgi:hypothetical protein|nr:MAG: hypothetical protein CVU50_09615 [Candidatus Cloacimonetes bacterium HGW-Cloacimonetes-3]